MWPPWAKCLVCWEDEHQNNVEFYGKRELVVLPCFHVVCSVDCFDSLFIRNGGAQSCPKCSRVISISEETKAIVVKPIDFMVGEEVVPKRRPGVRVCNLCIREGEAVAFCPECDRLLCEDCFEHHPFSVQSSNHNAKELPPGKNSPRRRTQTEQKCPLHPANCYAAFCVTCDTPVCQECRGEHVNCHVCSLKDALPFMKKSMEGIEQEMDKVLVNLQQRQSEAKTKITHLLKAEKDHLMKEVQCMMTVLVSKLYARERQLRSDIRLVIEESARMLRLREMECSRKSQSGFQYAQLISSLLVRANEAEVVDGVLGVDEGWLVAYRFAKKCHSEQLKVFSKFNRGYFEMDNHLRVDKAAYMTIENEITKFCKITYTHAPNVKKTGGPPYAHLLQKMGANDRKKIIQCMETQYEISPNPTPSPPPPPVKPPRRLAPGVARAYPKVLSVPATFKPAYAAARAAAAAAAASASASYRSPSSTPPQNHHPTTNGVLSTPPMPLLLQASTGMKLKPKVRPQMATRFTSTRTPSPPTLRPQPPPQGIRTYRAPRSSGPPPGLRLLFAPQQQQRLQFTPSPRFPSPTLIPLKRVNPLPPQPPHKIRQILPRPASPQKLRPILPAPPVKQEKLTPPRPTTTRKPRNCAVKRTGGGLCPKPNVEPLGDFVGGQLEIEQVIMDDDDDDDDDPISIRELMRRSMEIEEDNDDDETHDLVVDSIEGRQQLKKFLNSAHHGNGNGGAEEMGRNSPFEEEEVEADIQFDTAGGQDPLASVATPATQQHQPPIIPIPIPIIKKEFPSPPHMRQQSATRRRSSEASSPPPPPRPPTELEHTLGELAKEYQNEEGDDEGENGDEMELDVEGGEEDLGSPWGSMPAVPVLPAAATPSPPKKAKQTRKEQLVVNEFLIDDGISFENDLIQDKLASRSAQKKKRNRKTLPVPVTSPTSSSDTTPRPPGKREIKRKTFDPTMFTTPEAVKRIRGKVSSGEEKKLQQPKQKRKRERKSKSQIKKPKKTSLDPLKTTEDSDHDDYCGICRDGGDNLLCCDLCPKIFHPICHIPSLSGIPDGDFNCNFCKDRTEGCDPEKQPEKHIRNPEAGGIHADAPEFFKACKFLSDIFVWENVFDFRLLVDGLKAELQDEQSPLFIVRKRLANNEPEKFENAAEMLEELERIFQSYDDALKARKSSPETFDRLAEFNAKFKVLLTDYYPDFQRNSVSVPPPPPSSIHQ